MRLGCANKLLGWFAVALVLAGLSGCGPSAQPDRPKPAPPKTGQEPKGPDKVADPSKHAGHDHAASESTDVEKALAELSAEDRALAEKQKLCPVSDEPLGSMGVPPKVVVKDKAGVSHTVFLCCAGCESDLLNDPDTYLKKIASAEK